MKNISNRQLEKVKYFFRFLKEYSLNSYKMLRIELFKRYNYEMDYASYCGSNCNQMTFETWLNNKFSKESITSLFYTLINVRNAWYKDINGNLSINVDWKTLEELWLLEVIRNEKYIFDSYDINFAKEFLKINRGYTNYMFNKWQRRK